MVHPRSWSDDRWSSRHPRWSLAPSTHVASDDATRRTLRQPTACVVEPLACGPCRPLRADLAERAKVTRATFYNHYASPLDLLIQVLLADLERAHLHEEERRAEGGLSAAEILRLSIVDVADHIDRFKAIYQQAVHDPADGGVYEALVWHFSEYA